MCSLLRDLPEGAVMMRRATLEMYVDFLKQCRKPRGISEIMQSGNFCYRVAMRMANHFLGLKLIQESSTIGKSRKYVLTVNGKYAVKLFKVLEAFLVNGVCSLAPQMVTAAIYHQGGFGIMRQDEIENWLKPKCENCTLKIMCQPVLAQSCKRPLENLENHIESITTSTVVSNKKYCPIDGFDCPFPENYWKDGCDECRKSANIFMSNPRIMAD